MREYEFELRLCAHLETETDGIVARQVGGGVTDGARRVLDTVVIDPGPEFAARTAITSESIPPAAIHGEIGPGRAVRRTRAIDASPEFANRVIERSIDVGFFERVQRDGEQRIRQAVRYPDWIGPITAIENKPDLGTPGDLVEQLRLDVALGLVDRVILATASHVTAAHLNRLPDEIGVWRVTAVDDGVIVDVLREPRALPVDAWGLEIGDREPLVCHLRPVSPREKRRARIRMAERAYGKGWRPVMPGCAEVRATESAGSRAFPHCEWKERIVDPAGCGHTCPGFDPTAPPRIDRAAERASRTGWDADPDGVSREQVGLSMFEQES